MYAPAMTLHLDAAGITHRGTVRDNNEDCIAIGFWVSQETMAAARTAGVNPAAAAITKTRTRLTIMERIAAVYYPFANLQNQTMPAIPHASHSAAKHQARHSSPGPSAGRFQGASG